MLKLHFSRRVLTFILLAGSLFQMTFAQKFIDVWGGARSSMALRSDSTVWCWGANFSGKIGDGDTTSANHLYPVQVHGPGNIGYLTSVSAIMAGEVHNMALKSDSTIWCWGNNMFGQLGNNDASHTLSAVPVQVAGPGGVGILHSVIALGGRGYHSLAIRADSTVWCWGWNRLGELGNNEPAHTFANYPVQVLGLNQAAIMVTGGYDFSVSIMADHTLRAWGDNNNGALGNGTNVSSDTAVAVSGLTNVIQISCGWTHVLALRADSTVWCWGGNSTGQLGNGTHGPGTNSNIPLQVAGLSSVISVSGGDGSSLALKADGTVWKWGMADTVSPQTGPYPTDRLTPVQISQATGMTNVIIARARDYHNIAITADSTLWAWGDNLCGQLGDGTSNNVRNDPEKVIFDIVTGVARGNAQTSDKVAGFLQNYPNPLNPSSVIKFTLSQPENITLKIYDVQGKEVATLMNERKDEGCHEAIINARKFANGLYFCRLTAGSHVYVKKMIIGK